MRPSTAKYIFLLTKKFEATIKTKQNKTKNRRNSSALVLLFTMRTALGLSSTHGE